MFKPGGGDRGGNELAIPQVIKFSLSHHQLLLLFVEVSVQFDKPLFPDVELVLYGGDMLLAATAFEFGFEVRLILLKLCDLVLSLPLIRFLFSPIYFLFLSSSST